MWDASFAGADGGGWAGDASFATDLKKDQRATSIGERLPVPATISDLLEHLQQDDDKYAVGSFKFATVQTVGIVSSIENDNGTFTYNIYDPEDSEKTYVVIKYSSDTNSASYYDNEITEGSRVRAIGKLKGFDGANIIMLFNISELPDDKDYKIFQLEAKAAKLFFEKNVMELMKSGKTAKMTGMLAPPTRRGDSGNTGNFAQPDNKERLYNNSMKPEPSGVAKPLKTRINELLTSQRSQIGEEGAHIDWICKQLGNSDQAAVRTSLALLVDDGLAYEAASEDYFAPI